MHYNRNELRRLIMTILYQIAIYEKNNVSYVVDDVIKENIEIDNEFVKDLVYGVVNNIKEIDAIANKHLKNWQIDRLGKTDQAILRMSIYEMVYTDTPDIICINEAVELAKLYSDDAVKDVINAVLDSIYHEK
ncbi:MAG: transcription antitermination factor NusB [Bacilli bacterium]|nr:transcription antitermination factor NusB [Bacilli bacterium]MDD3305387.1 transcription antitermination factor NusB [Bacilli bacterium]MDD4054042.1 transcription antitermination factor NusB [Bacilli bacterium]MDD4411826.1 transcription antitermination factor NusB [Bacilli bacterium]